MSEKKKPAPAEAPIREAEMVADESENKELVVANEAGQARLSEEDEAVEHGPDTLDHTAEKEVIRSRTKYRQELVDQKILLSVRHLKMYFKLGSWPNQIKLKAVHDVSFDVYEGETFGIVGESGCGKSTTGRCIIHLYDITSGSIYYRGHRIAAGDRWNRKEIKYSHIHAQREIAQLEAAMKEELEQNTSSESKAEIEQRYAKAIAAIKERDHLIKKEQSAKISLIHHDNKVMDPKLMNEIQMIFQDPVDSLDPRMTVEDIIQEGLKIQGFRNRAQNHEKTVEILKKVGLVPEHASRYPHEFSGGQRQRIGIARALIMNPKLLICDEPISALDVSIRAQIINLLNDLKAEMGLTMIFIAHDLSTVKYFCNRIAVMYYGNLVELTTSDELFKHPLHPYTKSLLSAIPQPNPFTEKRRQRIVYHPELVHDYSKQKPTLREVLPGHFIRANDEELERYKEEIAKLDAGEVVIKNGEEVSVSDKPKKQEEPTGPAPKKAPSKVKKDPKK